MDQAPFFEDSSSAGYDRAADEAFRLYAEATGHAIAGPAGRLAASQALRIWLGKLDMAARRELPPGRDPLGGQPF
jgi:hypothetical protein